jgi:peroxiredoxin
MRKNRQFLFILIISIFFCASCAQSEDSPNAQEAAPDFYLQDIRDNSYALSSYRDKGPVLLFFWTTWCPYCRRELKLLNSFYPDLKKEGWELFAIAVGEPAYKVENFIRIYGLVFTVLLDKDTDVAEDYDILGVPAYILIDKKGRIIFRGNHFSFPDFKSLISGGGS